MEYPFNRRQEPAKDPGRAPAAREREWDPRGRKNGRLMKDDWAAWMDEEIRHEEVMALGH